MTSNKDIFKTLLRREKTFHNPNWMHTHPTVKDMAKAGFISTGPGDTVKCYKCDIQISGWTPSCDPKRRHQESNPACPLPIDDGESSVVSGASWDSGASVSSSGSDSGASSGSSSALDSGASGHSDDSGYSGMRQPAPSRADTLVRSATPAPSSVSRSRSTAPSRRPRRRPSPAPPKYKQVEERTKSFHGVNWPRNIDAQPDKLVKAGMYFIGPGDRVKCAFCGGKLKNWEPKDSAIEEHIKHFPDCSFVQNIEKQTEVLSKNIRSKKKTDNCISSDELMKQYAEKREKTKKKWRKALQKMGFANDLIRKAEKRCKSRQVGLDIQSVMGEIHTIEKEQFFRTDNQTTDELPDEGVESDEEEVKAINLENLSTEEQVQRLEKELKTVESERDQFQNLIVCKICLCNPSDTLFLTCRHFVTCQSCAERVRDCPICRQLILGTVDVFMS